MVSLTCCASPVFGPDGRLVGVLDISGDYRSFQRHTLGWSMSRASREAPVRDSYARPSSSRFHSRRIFSAVRIGARCGIAGRASAGDEPPGTQLLGIRQVDAVRRDFSMVFECPATPDRPVGVQPATAIWQISMASRSASTCAVLAAAAGDLQPRLRRGAGRPGGREPAAQPNPALTLDALNTGDARLHRHRPGAPDTGRDIPILIQGESGAGRNVRQAFHNSGPARDALRRTELRSIPKP